ncbi:hypothetical protein DERP_008881 [Dermatophagoides pteronyssinus]|uniref:Uncharacterized protein n=1 Tax=Dermatophagoides pteronyssinus TaxID=6956 RepID=A0ABQ8JN45_DERPT|nr:hypothetical protein DERP_008881 [Dermatophagoides pteronyssinus]
MFIFYLSKSKSLKWKLTFMPVLRYGYFIPKKVSCHCCLWLTGGILSLLLFCDSTTFKKKSMCLMQTND